MKISQSCSGITNSALIYMYMINKLSTMIGKRLKKTKQNNKEIICIDFKLTIWYNK